MLRNKLASALGNISFFYTLSQFPVEIGQHLDFHSGQTLATIGPQVFMSQHL